MLENTVGLIPRIIIGKLILCLYIRLESNSLPKNVFFRHYLNRKTHDVHDFSFERDLIGSAQKKKLVCFKYEYIIHSMNTILIFSQRAFEPVEFILRAQQVHETSRQDTDINAIITDKTLFRSLTFPESSPDVGECLSWSVFSFVLCFNDK